MIKVLDNFLDLDVDKIGLIIDSIQNIFICNGCEFPNKKVTISPWNRGYPFITTDRDFIYFCPDAIEIFIYAQITYQLAHEITHFHNSEVSLPQDIKWFDELLCSNASFFILSELIDLNDNDDTKSILQEYFNLNKSGKRIMHEDDLSKYLFCNQCNFQEPDDVYRSPHLLGFVLFSHKENFNFWKLIKLSKILFNMLMTSHGNNIYDFRALLDTVKITGFENELNYLKLILSPFAKVFN